MRFVNGILFILLPLWMVPQGTTDGALFIADSMPYFAGGVQKYFLQKMKIPMDVAEGSKSEKVYVKFIVDTSGKVSNPEIVKQSRFPSFDREALRLVTSMPDWTPGFDKGRKVSVSLTLPIAYKNGGTSEASANDGLVTEEHKKAMALWNRGHRLEKTCMFSEALQWFDSALVVEPDNKFALFDRGKAHLALGNTEKACDVWSEMIEKEIAADIATEFRQKYCLDKDGAERAREYLSSKKSVYFFSSGVDAMRLGKLQPALQYFDSCLYYKPTHNDALYNKGQIHNSLKQSNEACGCWKKLIEVKPEDAEVAQLITKYCNKQ